MSVQIDQSSAVWRQIVETLNARISELQEHLEMTGLSEGRTEHLRGQIAFAREVLALPDSVIVGTPSGTSTFL